jgi:hypothetical protein
VRTPPPSAADDASSISNPSRVYTTTSCRTRRSVPPSA